MFLSLADCKKATAVCMIKENRIYYNIYKKVSENISLEKNVIEGNHLEILVILVEQMN